MTFRTTWTAMLSWNGCTCSESLSTQSGNLRPVRKFRMKKSSENSKNASTSLVADWGGELFNARGIYVDFRRWDLQLPKMNPARTTAKSLQGNYLIIYRVDGNVVRIATVYHGARLLDHGCSLPVALHSYRSASIGSSREAFHAG